LQEKDVFHMLARVARKWRESEMSQIAESKCNDLSYRPCTGMSSLGWVLAHQAAVFDFSLNLLIKGNTPQNPHLFNLYTPGSSGDWSGTPIKEIQEYYNTSEAAFLDWIDTSSEEELKRTIKEGTAPSFFVGMTIREVIVNAFTHVNYHTGHLTAIRKDWQRSHK